MLIIISNICIKFSSHKIRFLLLLWILATVQGKAQHFKFNSLGLKEELPSNHIYKILEDSKGYVWFLTDKAVSRYDGKKFTTFDEESGYDETGAYQILEDKNGLIWILTTSFKVFVFNNGYFTKVRPELNFGWMQLTNEGNIAISGRSNGAIYTVKNDLSIQKIPLQLKGEVIFSFVHLNKYSYIIGNTQGVFLCDQHGSKKLVTSHPDFNNKVPRIFKNKYGIFITSEEGLYQFNPHTLKKRLVYALKGNELFDLYIDKIKGTIWLSTYRGLLKINNQESNKINSFLTNIPVLSTFQSKDNLLWIATAKGAYLCNFNAKHITQQDGLLDDNIKYIKNLDQIYFFSYEQQFYQLSGNQLKTRKLPNNSGFKNVMRYISSVDKINDSTLFIKGPWEFLLNNKGLKKYQHPPTTSAIQMNWDKGILLMGENNICLNDTSNIIASSVDYLNFINNTLAQKKIIISNSTPVYIDKDTFYLASNKGLVKVYWRQHKAHYTIQWLKGKIAHVLKQGDTTIVSTFTNGIYLITRGNVYPINSLNGLPSNYCSKSVIHNNSLWICTNKGLSRLNMQKHNEVNNFTSLDYLLGNEVNDVAFLNDTVYVATSSGVSYFSKNVTFSQTSPLILLNKIQINNRDTNVLTQYNLPYNYNNFTFDFSSPGYRSGNSNVYRFVLLSEHGADTNYNKVGTIQIGSLTPGTYQLNVSVKSIDGIWSKNPALITLNIAPVFWKTWWFAGLIACLLVTVTATIVWLNISKYKQYLIYQQKLVESELRSLRLYMNPHFIFNSLTSLQSFVLTSKISEANSFISKFSKLIRMIMHFSMKGEISLQEEIKLLTHYIDLEKMRFKNGFDYHIHVDPLIDTNDITIPSLLIQPIVENAIQHGLDEAQLLQGEINIYFSLVNYQILCVVQDNGKGRKATQENKIKKHEYSSSGIAFTEERIKLISHHKKPSIQVIDLEVNNQPAGTRVEITIPIIKNN